jgi:hypothetical protein
MKRDQPTGGEYTEYVLVSMILGSLREVGRGVKYLQTEGLALLSEQ